MASESPIISKKSIIWVGLHLSENEVGHQARRRVHQMDAPEEYEEDISSETRTFSELLKWFRGRQK